MSAARIPRRRSDDGPAVSVPRIEDASGNLFLSSMVGRRAGRGLPTRLEVWDTQMQSNKYKVGILMSAAEGNGREHTDIAALSAGVVAVAVSLFVTPGEYSVMNFVFSFTLIVVILAYVWSSARWWLQSLAVAATIGLASMPSIGFMDETVLSRSPLRFLVGAYDWNCNEDPCSAKGEHESRVPNFHVASGWLLVTVVMLAVDRSRQRKSRSKPKGPVAAQADGQVPNAVSSSKD